MTASLLTKSNDMNRDQWPDRIKALPVDKRGYPIPFVVLIDNEGTPHFKVNDERKNIECMEKKICHICGQPLKGEYWFIGGQLSAYHPKGVFNDGAVHYECGLFALHTCPYLANSNYHVANSDENIERMRKQLEGKLDTIPILNDPTQKNKEKLAFHCFVKAKDYKVNAHPGYPVLTISPKWPYEQVEFYVDGRRIHKAEAKQLLKDRNETSYLP
jgi:hypothetical protein